MKTSFTYADFYLKNFSSFSGDFEKIKNFVASCPTGDILDVGAGIGRTLGIIQHRKHILLESDPNMLAILVEQASGHENAEIIEGQCPKIPLPDSSVAGLFAAQSTIGEIQPICTFLSEIRRVLVPGGRCLIVALNPEKFVTGSTGIRRNGNLANSDFSSLCNTLPVEDLGKGEFQTLVWLRQSGQTSNFVVRQYFPRLQSWLDLFREAGLELITPLVELSEQVQFEFVVRKPDTHSPVFPQNRQPIVNLYDRLASDYSEIASKAQYRVPQWLSEHLTPYRNVHPVVLDLACGNGLVGSIFKEKEIHLSALYGYDISSEMVKECTKNKQYSHICRFDLSLGLPGFRAMSMDIVTAFGLFEFISDPKILLEDIARILVIGGELFCTFETPNEDMSDDAVTFPGSDNSILHFRRTKSTIVNLLEDCGLTVLDCARNIAYISPSKKEPVNYYFVRAIRRAL